MSGGQNAKDAAVNVSGNGVLWHARAHAAMSALVVEMPTVTEPCMISDALPTSVFKTQVSLSLSQQKNIRPPKMNAALSDKTSRAAEEKARLSEMGDTPSARSLHRMRSADRGGFSSLRPDTGFVYSPSSLSAYDALQHLDRSTPPPATPSGMLPCLSAPTRRRSIRRSSEVCRRLWGGGVDEEAPGAWGDER